MLIRKSESEAKSNVISLSYKDKQDKKSLPINELNKPSAWYDLMQQEKAVTRLPLCFMALLVLSTQVLARKEGAHAKYENSVLKGIIIPAWEVTYCIFWDKRKIP